MKRILAAAVLSCATMAVAPASSALASHYIWDITTAAKVNKGTGEVKKLQYISILEDELPEQPTIWSAEKTPCGKKKGNGYWWGLESERILWLRDLTQGWAAGIGNASGGDCIGLEFGRWAQHVNTANHPLAGEVQFLLGKFAKAESGGKKLGPLYVTDELEVAAGGVTARFKPNENLIP